MRTGEGTSELDHFSYSNAGLTVEGVAIDELAEVVGTPFYVYSKASIVNRYRRLESAFAPLGAHLHYAVKASPNLQLCRLLNQLGAGMDVVSGGELERAWLAGVAPTEIVFAGVAKTDAEIRAALDGQFSPLGDQFEATDRAIRDRGPVGLFNIESESEVDRIAAIASDLGIEVRACVRVNPDVDARTHEYTTTGLEENKFGIYAERVPELFDRFADHRWLSLVGVHVHIGSPVFDIKPYVETVEVVLELFDELERRGHQPTVLDLGGGWASDYRCGEAPKPADYAAQLIPLLEARVAAGLEVILEPGRSIMANSGCLITRVQHLKRGRAKRFVMCDAGMQTLVRPALYRATHFIWPTAPASDLIPPVLGVIPKSEHLVDSDIVGPICETGDFLARGRPLPADLAKGDLLAIFSAGAYGASMASNYNDHPRPAEVLVDGTSATLIAERQSLTSLFQQQMYPQPIDTTRR